MDSDLDTRLGWPAELRFLLDRYPREQWMAHANLGQMARFWLDRHQMFRELGGALKDATEEFRAGTVTPQEFQAWFGPRLQFFLQQLHAHHQIEDHHYFPIFRAAETRLVNGFEVLEKDHEILHEGILRSVESANEFLKSLHAGDDKLRSAGDSYTGVNEALLKKMLRHLDDEEDLIVPLILDRGEDQLGVG
ncbi:MAG: hemerythrin domain-containing protein [Xanthobacteraceae bacterium]